MLFSRYKVGEFLYSPCQMDTSYRFVALTPVLTKLLRFRHFNVVNGPEASIGAGFRGLQIRVGRFDSGSRLQIFHTKVTKRVCASLLERISRHFYHLEGECGTGSGYRRLEQTEEWAIRKVLV